MNKVDIQVKTLMLNCPTIFKCRRDVLMHIFLCNGNGMKWIDGVPINTFEKRLNDTMDYSDLDEERATHLNSVPFFKELLDVRDGFERVKREYIEKHIDVFASKNVERDNDINRLDYSDPDWCLLSDRDLPDNVDPDWAKAIVEFARDTNQCIFAYYSLGDCVSMVNKSEGGNGSFNYLFSNRVPHDKQKIYIHMEKMIEKFSTNH